MEKPRSHEINDEAKNYLRSFFSPPWNVEEIIPDYGLDFRITIVEEGKVTENFFFIQLKGTDNLKEIKDHFVFDIDVKHLLYFLKFIDPIIFLLYDTQTNSGYWINVQQYCRDVLNKEDSNWINQKYKRIKIPKNQILTDLDSIKKNILTGIIENSRTFTEKLEWYEGYEKELNNIEKIEELINKEEIDAIKKRIHVSILYFKMDDSEKMQEQFYAIYQQHRNDMNHLQAILAILTCSNIFSIFDIRPFLRLCKEGIKISKDLDNELYFDVFTFFWNYYISFSLIKEKLPILISRVQTIKKEIAVDDYIKFIWDFQNMEINKQLNEVNKKLMEILNKLLENGNIVEFLVLQLHIIQIEVFLNYTLKPFLENKIIQKNLEQHLILIKSVIKVAEKLENEDILLQTYLILGGYFELMDLEKGKDLYLKGLALAKEIKHQDYIRRFEYNIAHLGEELIPLTIDDIRKSSLSDNIQIIKQKFNNVDLIEDSRIKDATKMGLEDLDPLNYLKYCEFLLIAYNPSPLGYALQLYSLGWKTLGCKKKNVKIEPGNLKNLFKIFKKQFCINCDLRKQRSEDFDPPMKFLEEMYDSLNKIKKP